MRRAYLLASVLVLASLTGCGPQLSRVQNASAPASRLEIRLPEEGFVAGQPGQIEIRLLDAEGHPAPTAEAVTIKLASAQDLGLPESVELAAGSAGADIAVTPSAAGLVEIEARTKDDRLDPAFATAATLEAPKPTLVATAPEAEVQVMAITAPEGAPRLETVQIMREVSLKEIQARPSGRWADILSNSAAWKVAPRTGESPGTGTATETPTVPPTPLPPPESSPQAQPAADTASRVILRASPSEVVCGAGGWRPAEIDAFWTVGKKPTKTAEPIEIRLTATGRAGTIEPRSLTIPANGFRSEKPAVVLGREAGRLAVEAVFAGGAEPEEPIEIEVVADPGRLDIAGAKTIRGLAVARPTVTVRLVDPKNPALTLPVDKEVQVDLEVQGEGVSKNQVVRIDPKSNSGAVTLDLERHGNYQLTARAACIESGSLPISYLLDWTLIAIAAGAGLLGSLISHRPRRTQTSNWQKAARIAGGAAVAGLFALGLASLGLLSAFEKVIPLDGLWTQLDAVPALSFTGTAITGFLAGFLSEKLWAKLRG